MDHPELNRRERAVLVALRELTKAATDDGHVPPVYFDQEVVELAVGPAAGSLDALVRFRLATSRPGGRSPLGFAITQRGLDESQRRSRFGIRVPRSIGGRG
jgi:hypothetical protein